MGIATVAEYVESPALRDRLRDIGVQFGQGYAIGRPQPMAALFQSADAIEPAA
jgi:EAL domain-containing protein (putative c-di-GMP-specific phosphodiesterase class I)